MLNEIVKSNTTVKSEQTIATVVTTLLETGGWGSEEGRESHHIR